MSVADRVQETTNTTGTGTLSLAGAPTGRRTFVAAFGTGATVHYLIENSDGTQYEFGVGVVTSGSPDTLTRVTILGSSNANAAVNWAAGAKNVTVAASADILRFGSGVLPVATGTADARAIAHKPAKVALVDGERFWFINGAAANATTTPTLVIDAIGAKTGVDRTGAALAAGDWPANALIGVAYHAVTDKLRLLTPTVPTVPPAYAGGRNTIYVPAAAMIARTTNGAAAGSVETTTNKVMLKTLDFDASTIEYAQFTVRMPKSWNEGTVTAVFVWKHAATTTNFKVSWGLQAVALSDDDAADTAFGTAIYANDIGGTTNDIYISPETAAVTIAGTPAAEDLVVFQVLRKADDATNDTLAIDAGLLGVTLYLTTDAATDA
ncbi:MAG: hypothetical protein GC202_02040 [Alphaproteobacteria bacterium]|nr:hypothetical protein [Alphaproteobacteria bacterium]